MNEVTTVALKCLIMIITVVITSVVIPYIRGKMGTDRWNRLQEYIEYAVRCAEQIYGKDQCEAKKNYVMGYIISKAQEIGLNISEKDIDLLIEGIVNLIKHDKEYPNGKE